MFRGRYEHTIDSKGRLSIPSGFRVEIQRQSDSAPILTNHRNHLALYPREEWDQIEQKLMSKSNLQPNVQALQRFIIGGATECPIDSQGRILVPKNLRDHARLESKVTLAGVLEKVELWNPELYEQDIQRTLLNLDEIQLSVDQGPEY